MLDIVILQIPINYSAIIDHSQLDKRRKNKNFCLTYKL